MTNVLHHSYSEVPPRVRDSQSSPFDPAVVEKVDELLRGLPETIEAQPNRDGEVESLGTTSVTHRFVDAPGDSETVRWHLVEAGPQDRPTIVFLHGLPDSWWQWHYALEALSDSFHCLAIDLKGYGQSEKRTGDYRQAGVANQLRALLDQLGVGKFSLVTHDRGTPPADYLVANLGDRVTGYARGEQHLWHLHPDLHPQEAVFTSTDAPALLGKPKQFVGMAYTWLTERPVKESDIARTISEFSHPGIPTAVPRYFHSSSFRQEWIDRRTRLIDSWTAPVLVLQGAQDRLQPREFYTDPEVLARLPRRSDVHLFDCGHFWPFEAPDETVAVLRKFLTDLAAD